MGKKISQLENAGPITGAELVEVVQGGKSKKAAIEDLLNNESTESQNFANTDLLATANRSHNFDGKKLEIKNLDAFKILGKDNVTDLNVVENSIVHDEYNVTIPKNLLPEAEIIKFVFCNGDYQNTLGTVQFPNETIGFVNFSESETGYVYRISNLQKRIVTLFNVQVVTQGNVQFVAQLPFTQNAPNIIVDEGGQLKKVKGSDLLGNNVTPIIIDGNNVLNINSLKQTIVTRVIDNLIEEAYTIDLFPTNIPNSNGLPDSKLGQMLFFKVKNISFISNISINLNSVNYGVKTFQFLYVGDYIKVQNCGDYFEILDTNMDKLKKLSVSLLSTNSSALPTETIIIENDFVFPENSTLSFGADAQSGNNSSFILQLFDNNNNLIRFFQNQNLVKFKANLVAKFPHALTTFYAEAIDPYTILFTAKNQSGGFENIADREFQNLILELIILRQ